MSCQASDPHILSLAGLARACAATLHNTCLHHMPCQLPWEQHPLHLPTQTCLHSACPHVVSHNRTATSAKHHKTADAIHAAVHQGPPHTADVQGISPFATQHSAAQHTETVTLTHSSSQDNSTQKRLIAVISQNVNAPCPTIPLTKIGPMTHAALD